VRTWRVTYLDGQVEEISGETFGPIMGGAVIGGGPWDGLLYLRERTTPHGPYQVTTTIVAANVRKYEVLR
jgi:hypothetical protein